MPSSLELLLSLHLALLLPSISYLVQQYTKCSMVKGQEVQGLLYKDTSTIVKCESGS